MSIQNGKKPLSSKKATAATPLNADEIFGNELGVSKDMAAAIDKGGYTYRFISASKLAGNGGYHHRMWKPLPMKQLKEWGYATMDAFSFTIGNDPDGYVRRGDLVLAVRPKEITEKHRALLKQEAKRASMSQKKHSDELRQMAKEHGVDAQVLDTYEDEKEE